MTSELNHPVLGNVTGLDYGKTITYRGIKYADLQHAFAEPILFKNPRSSTIDATSYGPLCPQNPTSCDAEFSFIQHKLPREQFVFSLTECLNLNIVAPKEKQQLLPVFVFIYGGSFSLGGNSWPQYDPTRLVELSIEEESPIIGISINFSEWSFQNTSMLGRKWCESIMMGDCEMDSSILFYMLHDRQTGMEETFVKSASRFLKDSTTKEQLLSGYDIGDHVLESQDIASSISLTTLASMHH
ncbi:hypothetical protein IFR05_001443 [Cadophora sp. M221]|nr:hypothetical protein IFR05_001443 [Cadophora sp. M221]